MKVHQVPYSGEGNAYFHHKEAYLQRMAWHSSG